MRHFQKVRGALAEHFDVGSFKQTCNQGLQTVASTQTMNSAVCQDFEQSNWQQGQALQQLAQSEITARNCKVLVKDKTWRQLVHRFHLTAIARMQLTITTQFVSNAGPIAKLPQCAGLTEFPMSIELIVI